MGKKRYSAEFKELIEHIARRVVQPTFVAQLVKAFFFEW